jgi:ABC-type multidrug transport system fused ATPase/permease subunit
MPENTLSRENTRKTLKKYWGHIRKHRLLASTTMVAVIAASSFGVIVPLYYKKFFDALTDTRDTTVTAGILFATLLTIGVLELLRWLSWRIALVPNAEYQSRVLAELSEECFAYVHKHSFTYFNNNFVGTLVKRVNWFTRAFEGIMDRFTFNLVPLLTQLVIIFYVLTAKNRLLGAAIAVWIVVFLTINWFLTKYKLRYDIQRSEAESASTAILADTITNNSNVKLFCGYDREVAGFAAAVNKVRVIRRFTWTLDNIVDGVQGILVLALEMGIFYVAIGLWQRHILTVGDFVLIQSYVIIIFDKVWDFGKIIRYIYSDLADAEEMTIALSTPHEIQDVHNAKKLTVNRGEIQFKEVDFYYHETRKIFSKFNLLIQPHQKIALVGPSGAGKSTIVKLLLRMHDVARGKILIDGQKIDHVTQESLWKAVSLVPQDPILFHRTLMENIRYGRPDATDEEVFAAATKAHCHEFIEGFPEKYQTFVGERGVKLSGGERQRVAIARAILRNAPILVLDEATSSLDSESEFLIQDALNNLMKDKTVIVVAHRLSTIMKMDRIIVIDRAEIIEDGSHSELLKKKDGVYKKLWGLQAGGFIA